jgi:hypothetical protein
LYKTKQRCYDVGCEYISPAMLVTGRLRAAMDVILGHGDRTTIMHTPAIFEEEDLVIVTNNMDNSSTSEHVSNDRDISLIGPLVVPPSPLIV